MRIFLFAMVLAACVMCPGGAEARMASVPIFPVPAKIRISEGGYLSGSLQVELMENGMLRMVELNYMDSAHFRTVRKVTAPTIAAWRTFIRECDKIGVWTWKDSYIEPGIMDGLQWGVELVLENEKGEIVRMARSYGSNQFPPGQPITEGRSESYKAFWEAVKKLMDAQDLDVETMSFK